MFRGEIEHSVDAKGRLIVPLKFRENLGQTFIVTKGLDKCLFVYTLESWNEFEEKMQNLPVTDKKVRRFERFFFGAASEVEVDSQGRIMLPQSLRTFAGIHKDIISIGVRKRIEIWSKEFWDEYNDTDNFIDDEIAERMAELSI